MRINVIGCGYVGLVTGACFDELGHSVTCIDNDAAKIESLKNGVLPIHEKDLNISGLKFSTIAQEADITFICVGTPSLPSGECDLSFVEAACDNTEGVKVIKSTVPPGTCGRLGAISNPEFLQEGNAVHNFMNPDRIVVGCDESQQSLMLRVYAGIDVPVLFTTRSEAELIKYASNCFLATKLAFVNELSWVAEKYGADILTVTKGMGMDKRIGSSYLHPGPGFGGSCFPKDLRAMRGEMGVVHNVIDSNWAHKLKVAEAIFLKSDGTVGILGTAFKANTDDTRDSPSLEIVRMLWDWGKIVRTYDPVAKCDSTLDGVLACDVVAILTEWPEFKDIKHPNLLDFRYLKGVDTPLVSELGKQLVPSLAAVNEEIGNSVLSHETDDKILKF